MWVTQRCQTSPQARQTHGQSRLTSLWVDGGYDGTPFDLGHGRLPLDCPSRITTGADQRLCLAQKRWVVEHVRLADGVAPIG